MATSSRTWTEIGPHDKTDSSEDNADATSSFSLLYTLLPPLVQRRIPKLRSFKKALSDYDQRSRRTRTFSQTSVTSTSPPPSYRSNSQDRDSIDEQPGFLFRSGRHSEPPSRPSTSGTSTPTYLEETRSGVQWRYAEPGFALLSLSSHEASTSTRSSHLIRRQYVDGVACVLRGLPSDLSLEEELSLREAFPPSLSPPSLAESSLTLRNPSHGTDITLRSQSESPPSSLHRHVATLTFYLFLAISFITPYISHILQSAYAFDRKNHLSERALAQSVVVADAVGRQAMSMAREMCGWNEGRVGEKMKEVGVYVVQGFSGGVYCGLGEGMVAMGKQRREDGMDCLVRNGAAQR
ncbi:unnamed protein product [Zymoseptoria tritici ST99CH_3D7]|uniref:Uncharacterized protein n=1 Tax=Zymoseptoria tritici (strain ST99CH_3D7) TaxID=1276538 RepID=A0A1X7RER1_ZYMT9|nr:unnamed protein product [Zymoseptoria tritici ST99CH_3D7]